MYLVEVEFYSWADLTDIKASYINGTTAIFKISEDNLMLFIDESDSREDVKHYDIFTYMLNW